MLEQASVLQFVGGSVMLIGAIAQYRRGIQPKGASLVAILCAAQLISLLIGESFAALLFGTASVFLSCGLLAINLYCPAKRSGA